MNSYEFKSKRVDTKIDITVSGIYIVLLRLKLKASTALRTFARDNQGQLTVVVALSALPALAAAGAGIDYSRMNTSRANLQTLADSAVLGAQLQSITTNAALLTYVQTRVPTGITVSNATYTSSTTKMCATLTQSVPTIIMKIARISSMSATATACSVNASSSGTTYEIAMALDNTGSMSVKDTTTNKSKLDSSISAAKSLVSQVFAAAGTSNVKISVVPFTTAVNVGTSYASASWMDTTGRSSMHWENFPKQNTTAEQAWNPQSRFDLFTQINQSWGGCVEERPQPYTLTDTAADPNTPDTLYVPLFAPDESDSPNSGYKSYNSYLSDSGGICASGDAYATADKNGKWGDNTNFFNDGQTKLCKYAVKYAANNPSSEQTSSDVQSAISDWISDNFSNSSHDSNNWTFNTTPSYTYCGSNESYCKLTADDIAKFVYDNNLYSVSSDNKTVNFCTKFSVSWSSRRSTLSVSDTSACYSYYWRSGYTLSTDKSASLPANYVNNPQGTATANTTVSTSNYSASNTFTAWKGSGWNYGGNGWGTGSGFGWGGTVSGKTYSTGFNPSTSNPGYTAAGVASNSYIGRNQFNLGGGANSGCDATLQPLQTLTNNQSTVTTLLDKMKADGATNLVSGLLWAWRTISPTGPFASGGSPRPYSTANNKKILVFMSDGQNNWDDNNSQNGGVYSSFGYYKNNRIGSLTVNGTSQTATASNNRDYLDAAFLQACTNAKNAGVEIYTVAFSISGAAIDTKGQNVLKSCASDTSHFQVATNGTELSTFFGNIGTSIMQKSIKLTN